MMRVLGLTKQQHAALAYIATYIYDHGYSPSYAEIAAAVGLRARSGAHRIVDLLLYRGHLVHAPGRARSLALPTDVAPTEAALAATLRRYVELSGPITINDCPAAAAHLARTVPAIPRASA